MEFLKDVLGEELYKQVEEKLKGNDKIKLANLAEGKYVGKDKFDAETEKVKDYQKQIGDRDKQLKGLQEKAKGNEDFENTIKTLQDDNKTTKKTYEDKLLAQSRDHAIEDALRAAKAKNPKAVRALLKDGDIKYKDGELEGLKPQLDELKKNEAYQFDIPNPDTGGGGNPSKTDPPPSETEKLSDEDFYKQKFKQGE